MIKVYHNPEAFGINCIRYYHSPVADEDIPNISHCILVATVDTDKLQVAYELTQTREVFWWYNIGVQIISKHPVRSTAVGDLLVDDDGKIWMVAFIGFKPVGTIQ